MPFPSVKKHKNKEKKEKERLWHPYSNWRGLKVCGCKGSNRKTKGTNEGRHMGRWIALERWYRAPKKVKNFLKKAERFL